jgi:hypothetical protein
VAGVIRPLGPVEVGFVPTPVHCYIILCAMYIMYNNIIYIFLLLL